MVPRRVELPQVESPLLAREDQADEHNLDYVDKFELLVHQGFDACLESGQLSFFTPRQARLLPGGEPRRGSGSKLGGCDPFGVAWLGDVKLPRLPPLQGLYKGALEPEDVGHLANHGSSALRLVAAHHLRLDVESLEP